MLRAIIAITLIPSMLAAADLQTGVAFRRTLDQNVEAVSWSGKPLRGALDRVVETQHIAVMLDRRIDPNQDVEFAASGIPLESLLQGLARKYKADAASVGSVVYVGPPETTDVLATVVEIRRDEIGKLPATARARLLKATPWQWERLTTPRQLLDELERQYRVTIDGKEKMPHDLWPAVQLPELGLAEKLSLVLAGFQVTFAVSPDGSKVRLVPMPTEASLVRRYPAGASAARLAGQLAGQFPKAKITASGTELVVEGRWEVHDAVDRLLSGQSVRRPPPADSGKKNYTLTVENKAVGGVLRALGGQLGKAVSFDDVKVPRRLTKEVSVSVKEATLDELFAAVLQSTGLKYEITPDGIRVYD